MGCCVWPNEEAPNAGVWFANAPNPPVWDGVAVAPKAEGRLAGAPKLLAPNADVGVEV